MGRLVGLGHQAQVGKDTLADYLVNHKVGWHRVAFADAIRRMAQRLMDPEASAQIGALGWEAAQREIPWVRPFLQRLGVTIRHEVDEHFWTNQAMDLAGDIRHNGGHVVVTDVRFFNEAEAIKNLGGKVFKVTRPGVSGFNEHITEMALIDYDFDGVINNNDTPEWMMKQLYRHLRYDGWLE